MSFESQGHFWDPDGEQEGPDWTKEPSRRDSRFDFDAFLGPDSLEDKITDALDGKDLLDKEAYGEFPPDYVPRRAASGERGRHEAPGPSPEEEEEEVDDGLPTQRFSLESGVTEPRRPVRQEPAREQTPLRPVYREEPPPRPKVVVAEPAPRVYVTPQTEYDEQPPRGGGGKTLKWLVALLLAAAVILAAVLAVSLFAGGGPDSPAATQAPTPTDHLSGLLPPSTPAPSPSPTPEPTPSPTPRVTYTITVTAGSGGSISPNGTVDVEEGGSVTFAINPSESYELAQLLIDGSPVSVQSSYTFSDVKSNHTIYAVFQLKAEAPPTDPPPTQPPATAEPSQEPEPTAEPTQEPEAPPPAEAGGEAGEP